MSLESFLIDKITPSSNGRFYAELETDKGKYWYVPKEFVYQGLRQGENQFFDQAFLNEEYLNKLKPIRLDDAAIPSELKNAGYKDPSLGFLITDSDFNKYDSNGNLVFYYEAKGKFSGAARGIAEKDGELVYSLEGGEGSNYGYFDKNGVPTATTVNRKTRFGIIGDIARGLTEFVAGVPLLPEVVGFATGNPALYASLKSAQVAGQGGDLEDVIKAGGTAYLASAVLPGAVKNVLPAEVAAIPGAVPAVSATTTSLLTGQPIETALKTGVAAGAGSVVGGQVAGATGSQAAGQVVGGTTAGLLSGRDAVSSAVSSLIGVTAQQAGNLVNRALFSSGSSNMEDSFWNDLYAADAEQLAAQGIGQQQIADILQFSGADPFVAYDAAQLATQGLKAGDILKNLNQLTAPTTGGVPSGTAGKLASTAARSLLQRLTGTGGTAAGGAAGGNLANTLLNALLGTGTGSGGLLSRGIDYATAEKIADQLRREGATITEQAQQAAQAAQVPFTPYTVTTGLGTSTFGPTGATVTPTAPYSAIQQEALQQAQEALGAISPAQASQTLFGQLEGLQAPFRQRQQEELLSRLGARGLLGFGQNLPTVGGGMGTVNPYMESLLSAQATQQAQNALAAQQFGTQEAARQQALAQALTTQGMGIDQQTAALLTQAANIGAIPMNLALTNRGRQLEASLRGLGLQVPFSTSAANIQAGQTGLLGQTAKDVSSAVLKEILG